MSDLRNRRPKPVRWNVGRHRVAPRWRWFYRDLVFFAPLWGPDPVDLVTGQTMTANGTPAFTDRPPFGQCVDYDGAGDVHELDYAQGSLGIPSLTYPLTLAVIAEADSLGSAALWIGDKDAVNNNVCWLGISSSSAALLARSGTSDIITGPSFGTDQRLMVGRVNGSNDRELFVDGELAGTSTVGKNFVGSVDRICVGGRSSTGIGEEWDGPIWWAAAWNRQLSVAEIARLHSDPFGMMRLSTPQVVGALTLPQFLRPFSTDSNPHDWTRQPGAVTTDLHLALDEVSPDDADYIQTP